MLQYNKNFFTYTDQRYYKLISYSREEYQHDWKSFEHMHSHTEIMFITGGRGFFCYDKKMHPLTQGTVIIINPFALHKEISSEDDPLSFASFLVENLAFSPAKPPQPETEESDNESFRSQQVFLFDFARFYGQLFHFLEVIERECVCGAPFWQFAFMNEFDDLMLFLYRHTSLISLPHQPDNKPNTLSHIRQYIHSRYTENISLEKLAQMFYLNKYYLSHAFKEKYQVSPILYLNQCRCETAHRLLLTTNLSISEIATSVGFNSIVYFSKIYKKFYGISPSLARKKSATSPEIDTQP